MPTFEKYQLSYLRLPIYSRDYSFQIFMNKTKHIEKTIAWALKKGFSNIKADIEGYEKPIQFERQGDNVMFNPDMTVKTESGKTHYFQVVLKADNLRRTVSELTLFHEMAKVKDGKLFLMAPSGHIKFAKDILESGRFELAEIVKI